MARVSNICVAVLNLCFLALGVITLGSSLLIHSHGGGGDGTDPCQKSLYTPLLIVGISLSVISLLGFIGSCCRNNFLLYLFLFVLSLLIVALFIFTIFSFVVTSNGAGKAVSGLGFEEYRLGDYKNWLKNHSVNDKNWNVIRSCVIDAQVCKSLDRFANQTASEFYKRNLSPIQSGCCKPPVACGFQYSNATSWKVPKSGPAVQESDCFAWSNQQDTLCFNCNTCKAGVVVSIKKEWKVLVIINACIFCFLVIVFSFGCCALKNNKRENRFTRFRGSIRYDHT